MIGWEHNAFADEITGTYINKSGKTYIEAISQESGDIMIYSFKPNSSIGQKVAQVCYPTLECKIEKAKAKDITTSTRNDWQSASVIFDLISGDPNLSTGNLSLTKKEKSRFGTISISDDGDVFLNKKKLSTIQNDFPGIVGVFEEGQNDLVLIHSSAGTSCPALLTLLTLSKSGVVISPAFGSCSDIYHFSLIKNGLLLRSIDTGITQTGKKGLIEYTVIGSKVRERKIALP